MKTYLRWMLPATVVIACTPASFGAQIIFSNLVGPGGQYGPDPVGIGHTPSFLPGDTGQVQAATGFTPSATFQLTDINIPLGYVGNFLPGSPNQADVFLVSDLNGLPGSTIESWHLTNLPTVSFGMIPLTLIPSTLNPTLLPAHQYWVVATGGTTTFDLWSLTLPSENFSPMATRSIFNGIDSGWVSNNGGRQGALQVLGQPIGTATPEPATSSLMALAAVMLAIFVRRSRTAASA